MALNMATFKKIFIKSPFFIKRLFANAEAVRRDHYRRYGDYKALLDSTDINNIMESGYKQEQEKLFLKLMDEVSGMVPRYRGVHVQGLKEIQSLPFLTKADMIHSINSVLCDGIDKKECYINTTSGSTGTPVQYYQHREGVRLSQLYADKLLEFAGYTKKDRKVRISGINLIPFETEKPPFWLYIDRYRQLQLSAYHIKDANCEGYINAMKKYKVTFGTGYATAWLFLAEYILSSRITPPPLKAIVTDSEGISIDEQIRVEQAFGCRVYQTYGLSETGQLAFQCRERHYHLVPSVCYAEIVDEGGKNAPDGETGEIVVTSLLFGKTPFIRYKTGDLGALGNTPCPCGWNTQYLTAIEGRVDDYVLTPDGRKIGRLSHITKPIRGIVKSQIVQLDREHVLIRVIPDTNFDESSMDDAIAYAENYLGDMQITWEKADELEKTKSGKVRYVIRKF